MAGSSWSRSGAKGGGSVPRATPAACRACALRSGGFTYRAIADALNAEGFTPERGARIHASVVRRWINNPSLARAAGV